MGELSESQAAAHLALLGPLDPRELTAVDLSRICSRVIAGAFADLNLAESRLSLRTWENSRPPEHARAKAVRAVFHLRSAIDFVASCRLEAWAAGTALGDLEIRAIRRTFLRRARPVLGELVANLRARGWLAN